MTLTSTGVEDCIHQGRRTCCAGSALLVVQVSPADWRGNVLLLPMEMARQSGLCMHAKNFVPSRFFVIVACALYDKCRGTFWGSGAKKVLRVNGPYYSTTHRLLWILTEHPPLLCSDRETCGRNDSPQHLPSFLTTIGRRHLGRPPLMRYVVPARAAPHRAHMP